MIKVRDFETGRLDWIIQGVQFNSMNSCKGRPFPDSGQLERNMMMEG